MSLNTACIDCDMDLVSLGYATVFAHSSTSKSHIVKGDFLWSIIVLIYAKNTPFVGLYSELSVYYSGLIAVDQPFSALQYIFMCFVKQYNICTLFHYNPIMLNSVRTW